MLRFTTVGDVFTKSGMNSKCQLLSKFWPPIENSSLVTGLTPRAHPKSSSWAHSGWEVGPQIEESCLARNASANQWKTSSTTDDADLSRLECRELGPDYLRSCVCPSANSCRSLLAATSERLSSLQTIQCRKFHRSFYFRRQKGSRYRSEQDSLQREAHLAPQCEDLSNCYKKLQCRARDCWLPALDNQARKREGLRN